MICAFFGQLPPSSVRGRGDSGNLRRSENRYSQATALMSIRRSGYGASRTDRTREVGNEQEQLRSEEGATENAYAQARQRAKSQTNRYTARRRYTAEDQRGSPVGNARDLQIGARVRHARILKGMLVRELAAAVGCTESTISKIENDRILPSIPMMQNLITALDRDMASFFGLNPARQSIVQRARERPVTSAFQFAGARGSNMSAWFLLLQATSWKQTST